MILYSYWRSTTAYRVRIALALKGLTYETRTVPLLAAAQRDPDYLALNPAGGVPTLVLPDGAALTQSMAILGWLEAEHPEPPLLPDIPLQAARVRAAAFGLATDVHPVNNLRVTNRLKAMGHGEEDIRAWLHHWVAEGLTAFQALAERDTAFAFGAAPGLADICLVPQLYNARRWECDLSPFARLTEIEERCLALPAFQAAHPDMQPDAETAPCPT